MPQPNVVVRRYIRQEGCRMSDEKNSSMSWLVPAMISGVISLAAIIQSCQVATSSQEGQKTIEVAKIKCDIVKSIDTLEFRTAKLLIDHTLKPLDKEPSLRDFEDELLKILNERAPQTNNQEQRASLDELTKGLSETLVGGIKSKDIDDLVKKFDGDERLIASNHLIGLYNENRTVVVKTLIDKILPENDPRSYRRNLYIAFTLARIKPYWEGSREQIEAINSLKHSSNYSNETFRKRIDEAISNHKLV
jgi:hypothetical protein